MNRTVLIVDDDPMALKLLEHHLTKAGYGVLAAEHGLDALDLVEREAPSVIITDWVMPRMDGLDLCRAIRESNLGCMYIIVLTAHGEIDRVVEAFEAGADDYLTKPFNQRELLARLRAGERIVDLERNLARQQHELTQRNCELESAHSQLQLVNRELDQLATTDVLTGLPNRRAAMVAMENCWTIAERTKEPLSVVLIDIDNFKSFNDEHGHDIGDTVLREAAELLDSVTRASEHVYRVGGEEFLLICPQTNSPLAAVAAERMRRVLESRPISIGDERRQVTASFGVAESRPGLVRYEELLKLADQALYAGKKAGRNTVQVSPLSPIGVVSPDDEECERRAAG